MSQRTIFILGIALIVVLSVSIIATINLMGGVNSASEFFVGVEFAYDKSAGDVEELVNDLKVLVDKVKDYTNLFVIGSLEISFNRTALDAACDYVVDSGLYLIVFFTDLTMYNYTFVKDNKFYNYTIFNWMEDAKQKYGDKFLGIYRYDEPGGNQLDKGPSLLIEGGKNYTDVAANYTNALDLLVDYYKNYSSSVFTSDYGLYWFDYKAGYNAVFADFGFNLSRPLNIALCRGAATAQNQSWGAIVTWTYNEDPYLENGTELYSDLKLAYDSGAKYTIVFSYPKIGPYGTLSDKSGHFEALQKFWDYVHSNPNKRGVNRAEAAYVLPMDYGFGFRRADDTIWGLWDADELSEKVWSDVNKLIAQYGSQFDVVYDDPEFIDAVKSRYDRLFFWNETVS